MKRDVTLWLSLGACTIACQTLVLIGMEWATFFLTPVAYMAGVIDGKLTERAQVVAEREENGNG